MQPAQLCTHAAPASCRFVTLIDVMYEHRIRAFISAEAKAFDLFDNILTQTENRLREGNMVGFTACKQKDMQ